MKLQRCNNGHFYDGDKFANCPHCSGAGNMSPTPATPAFNPADDDKTVSLNMGGGVPTGVPAAAGGMGGDVTVPLNGGMGGDVTVPLNGGMGGDVTIPLGGGMAGDVTVPLGGGMAGDVTVPVGGDAAWRMVDDEKTVSFYELNNVNVPGAQAQGVSPAVGWLICVKGKLTGRDWRLVAGRNSIGREAGMDVQLSGEASVSRHNHAAVIFEPRLCKFYAVPGESRALAYLNGEVLLGRMEMKKNDKLELGDAELMLIPCCDERFSWSKL